MDILISTPTNIEMTLIHHHVKDFVLDAEDLQKEQFLIARHKNTLIGFGRLRKHKDCTELCTLGVLPEHRGKGVGKKITNKLIKKAHSEIYVVCIIPNFFQKFGFEIVKNYPSSIARKHHLCTTKFIVDEAYCVMRFSR